MASMGHKHRQREQKSLKLQEAQIEEITKRVASQLTISQSETFSGPYPPPKYADEYEKIFPGFLKKTIDLAETEQSNYFNTIKRRDWQGFGLKAMSLLVVCLFALSVVSCGFYLLLKDKSMVGFGFTLTGVAPVVYAIWNNRVKKDKSN